mgnify:CR=1 FL=1
MSNKETVLDLAYYCNGCEHIRPDKARDTRERVSIICTQSSFCRRVAEQIEASEDKQNGNYKK